MNILKSSTKSKSKTKSNSSFKLNSEFISPGIAKINAIWKETKFSPPSISVLVNTSSSEIFAVIDDSSQVYRLLDQFGNILGLVPTSSIIKNGVLWVEGQPILLNCRYGTRDQFVYNNIRSLIFDGQDLFQ